MCRPVIRNPIATTVLLRIAARTGRAEVFKLVRGERRAWRNQFPVSINLFVDVLRSRRDVALLVPVVPALVRDRIPEAAGVRDAVRLRARVHALLRQVLCPAMGIPDAPQGGRGEAEGRVNRSIVPTVRQRLLLLFLLTLWVFIFCLYF